jgi:hypothetical protein
MTMLQEAVVRRPDGQFATVQIKAHSKDVIEGELALFAAHPARDT